MLKEEDGMTTTANMRRRPAKFQQKIPGRDRCLSGVLNDKSCKLLQPGMGKVWRGSRRVTDKHQMQRWNPCTWVDKPRVPR